MRTVSQTIAILFYGMLSTAAIAQPVVTPPPFTAQNPTLGTLPSYNDASANWKKAGLLSVGGIPNRTTQCGSTVNPRGGGLSDTANIQAAIDACSTNQVVQLGSGSFCIPMAGFVHINKSIVLRGADACPASTSVTGGEINAYCATILEQCDGLTHVNGSQTCQGGSCSGAPVILMSPPQLTDMFGMSWSDCSRGTSFVDATCGGTVAGLTADAAKGDTTIQLNTTTPFSVGMWVLVTEASGALWITDPVNQNFDGGTTRTQVWAASDAVSSSGSPATGRNVWAQYNPFPGYGDFDATNYPYQSGTLGCGAWSYCDRATQEIHVITAIGAGPCPGVNCTLTFDSPLMVAFRQSGGAQFTGSLAGGVLTVTSVASGTITIRAPLTDVGSTINGGTYIISQASGTTGGAGTYNVPGTQTLSSRAMAAGGHAAKVLYPTTANSGGSATAVPFLQFAGVENLTVWRGNGGNILITECAYCWVKNVDSGRMANGAVEVIGAARVQIDTVFGHDCWNNVNNGSEYPFDFSWGATENYFVNSISRACGKGMTARAGGAGSVVAYNYVDAQYYGSGSTLNYWLIDASVDGSHFTGPHHILFEGNWGVNFLNDHVHGNSVYHTYFRSHAAGYRTPFTDNQTGTSVNDFTNTGEGASIDALRSAIPTSYHYWYAFVGNVLGTAGSSTSGNGWTYQTGTGAQSGIHIWDLGADDPMDSYDSNLSGANGSYYHRHGNYDTINGSIADWNAAFSRALPNSYYLAAKPSFFAGASCTYPWPWVTPTAGTQLQPNSCAGSGNPPKARYDTGKPFIQP